LNGLRSGGRCEGLGAASFAGQGKTARLHRDLSDVGIVERSIGGLLGPVSCRNHLIVLRGSILRRALPTSCLGLIDGTGRTDRAKRQRLLGTSGFGRNERQRPHEHKHGSEKLVSMLGVKNVGQNSEHGIPSVKA
jgi:hypothetical protein